jgi:small-conductance mechanosensitive channel
MLYYCSIQSTTVSTFDNVELVVPNQRFLTSMVRTYEMIRTFSMSF